MKITINDQAKKLLKEKNKKHVLVSLFQQFCWGGRVNRAVVVSMADKFDAQLYSKYVVDGIDVYIDYRLNIGENVEIGVEKFLFMKYFNQVGITAL